MPHKVKEEVTIWDADDLVSNLDKQGETLGSTESETLGNTGTEVFGASARVNFKRLGKTMKTR